MRKLLILFLALSFIPFTQANEQLLEQVKGKWTSQVFDASTFFSYFDELTIQATITFSRNNKITIQNNCTAKWDSPTMFNLDRVKTKTIKAKVKSRFKVEGERFVFTRTKEKKKEYEAKVLGSSVETFNCTASSVEGEYFQLELQEDGTLKMFKEGTEEELILTRVP